MMIAVEGHHLRSVDLGRGTPLLMHDGWVASWDLWLPLIERLQHRWRCIAYDHRGTGASTFPPDAISAPALVDDVFRVLDAHRIERAVIAGESLGSLVCMQAVLRSPARFAGLVLVGSSARTGPARAEHAAALRADWPGYIEDFVTACLPEADAGPLHRLGQNALLPAGADAAARMSAAHAELAPALESIAVPTLVLHGAEDLSAPLAGAREVAARIPGAELVVFDDAGHVPILTRPDAVAAAIDRWWDRVQPQPGAAASIARP